MGERAQQRIALRTKMPTHVAETLSASRSALSLTAAMGPAANITAALLVEIATTRCPRSITSIATSAQMGIAEQVAFQTTRGPHHAVGIVTPRQSTTQALIVSIGFSADPLVPLCCRRLP